MTSSSSAPRTIDLESHGRIQIHQGKIKVWNRAGLEPEACSLMQEAAERMDLDATVRTGMVLCPCKVSEFWGSQSALQSCAITIGADQSEAQGSIQLPHPC